MSATATTKLQVNYKLADGTLINIYADGADDLTAQLSGIIANAETIAATAKTLGMSGAMATVATTLGATPLTVVPNTPANIPDGHCKHGKLTWKESKPDAPKPWKGWFCPSPKGTPDQCSPKFVR